jgi:glyoxalase family protein
MEDAMRETVNGLHHVTMFAGDPRAHDAFYREALGLRRVKVTVNFDAPDVYHLYYGDRMGAPGTAWTSFPFGRGRARAPGGGRGGGDAFAVPRGSLDAWAARLAPRAVRRGERFGRGAARVRGADRGVAGLVERGIRGSLGRRSCRRHGDRGVRAVTLALRDAGPTRGGAGGDGVFVAGQDGSFTRMTVAGGNPADAIDWRRGRRWRRRSKGAGSTHHIAFSVDDDVPQGG